MCERESKVLPERSFVVGLERWRMQQTCDPSYVVVSQQVAGILIEKSGGDEHFELLVAIELQYATDAVQDFLAHATATRFESAERAAIDIGQLSHLLLGQSALAAEPRQDTS